MNYELRYTKPAIDSDYGWEHQSLPIGCGWFGANVFGIAGRDRIQITENSLQNPGPEGGLTNFAELYLHFDHQKVTHYRRGLRLNDAVAYTYYKAGGAVFRREYFASYPDRTLVIRLTGEKPFSFRAQLCVPFVKTAENGCGKSAGITCEGNRIKLHGRMEYYNIRFAGELAVVTDGAVTAHDGLQVQNATHATVYMTLGTNYELCPQVFLQDEPKQKLRDFDPAPSVSARLENALSLGYDHVRSRHLADYRALFGRVELDLGGECTLSTDQLLRRYARGENIPYLEALYFQFGRYLLISSSRQGTLPANLQGVWNVHEQSPWGSGYWHNINVQMNYWPAFSTNLAETFAAYADFNAAFRPKAQILAQEYIRNTAPENYGDGKCGWTVGTGVYPYSVEGPGGHSGPGTGGLTSKLFWDHYDFTRDKEILRQEVYPALRGMSEFLTKTVSLSPDGIYRAIFSASPEQQKGKEYYHTCGCAFDQQMIWENGRDFLAAAQTLGLTDDPLYRTQKEQIDRYHPVRIGGSGQIKEFEEENLYSEIGEYTHRHISQLIGAHPGTLIRPDAPAWMDAARITLTQRGERTTGWALAHRLNAWARLGDGARAYRILRRLLGKRTTDNLWDFHPPFQIDGNFGGTAGIAQMLLQSHDGCIRILPALPKAWPNGCVRGLVARGAFEIDIVWKNAKAEEITVRSKVGGPCCLVYPNIGKDSDRLLLQTEPGQIVRITDIPAPKQTAAPRHFSMHAGKLRWKREKGILYRLYCSTDDEKDYRLLGTMTDSRFQPAPCNNAYILYKLTAQAENCRESEGAILVCSGTDRAALLRHKRSAAAAKCKDLLWYLCCEADRITKSVWHLVVDNIRN